MQIRSLASVAIAVFAAQTFAQQQATKPVFKRSITTGRDLGFMRRTDSGYSPEDEVCNKGGNTCAEACGSGYLQCKSTDQAVHCYNPAAGETCCSTTSGNSCLSSFYCTHDTTSETFCCPNGMNLGDCAVKHGVAGALTSDVPVPTTTSTSSTSSEVPSTSSSAAPTTTSMTSSIVVTTSSTITSSTPSTTSIILTTSFSPSAGTSTIFAAANSTLATASTAAGTRSGPVPTSATPSPSAPEVNAGSSSGPAGVAIILGAAFVAALL